MKILSFFFLALLLLLLIILGGAYLLFKVLTNFQPSNAKVKADLAQMKKELMPWIKELAPWDDEERELLSLEHQVKKKSLLFGTDIRGKIVSIYSEPVIAYGYRKYLAPGHNAVLYARTSKHEFLYRIKNRGVEIKVNGKILGTLNPDGLLYSARGKRLLARINRSETELLSPIIIKDREMGSLVNPELTQKVNPRAFELLEDMNAEEEEVFLSLAVLELVNHQIQ